MISLLIVRLSQSLLDELRIVAYDNREAGRLPIESIESIRTNNLVNSISGWLVAY